MPTWLTVGLEVAKLTPDAIRLVRDIIAAIKEDPGSVDAMRARALGTAAGQSAYRAAMTAHHDR